MAEASASTSKPGTKALVVHNVAGKEVSKGVGSFLPAAGNVLVTVPIIGDERRHDDADLGDEESLYVTCKAYQC